MAKKTNSKTTASIETNETIVPTHAFLSFDDVKAEQDAKVADANVSTTPDSDNKSNEIAAISVATPFPRLQFKKSNLR